MANQKLGSAMPIWLTPITRESAALPRRLAANRPIGMASTTLIASASSASGRETHHPLGHQLGDGHAIGIAHPEIAMQQPCDPVQVSLGRRRIEDPSGRAGPPPPPGWR